MYKPLPAGVKAKQEVTLIEAKDYPGQGGPLSLSLWIPSDDKQHLTVSKRRPETLVLCQTIAVTEDLVAFRFKTQDVTITTSTADPLVFLYFCVLCVGQGHDLTTFQFLRPTYVAPTSPATDRRRHSWKILVPGQSQLMPALQVDVATLQITSKTSQSTYAFSAETGGGQKGVALLTSLMSPELNQRLLKSRVPDPTEPTSILLST